MPRLWEQRVQGKQQQGMKQGQVNAQAYASVMAKGKAVLRMGARCWMTIQTRSYASCRRCYR